MCNSKHEKKSLTTSAQTIQIIIYLNKVKNFCLTAYIKSKKLPVDLE